MKHKTSSSDNLKNMNSKKKQSFLAMIFGGVFLVSLVVVLNNWESNSRDKNTKTVNFDVKQLPKKKNKIKKKKIVKKRKPKQQKKLRPKLSQQIRGASFGLKLFEMDLNNISDSLIGDASVGVMSENSVDEKPKVLSRAPLEYPASAKSQGIKGEVVLRLLVNSNGRVDHAKVFKSVPAGVFDMVAKNSAKAWLFEPAKYQGRKVAVWVKQKIRFDFN